MEQNIQTPSAYPSRFQCLSGNALKIIAITTMLIDHIGAVLIENGILGGPFSFDWDAVQASAGLTFWWNVDVVLRAIGRIAFPIFAYLLVEGFLHTRDVKKYGLRLLVFGLLSEIPFDLAIYHAPFYWGYQNVYFTLFLGLIAMAGIQKCENERMLWKQTLVLLLCCGASIVLNTDYGAFGVIFIALLYMTRRNPRTQTIFGVLALIWEVSAVLAFIPIRMYNGARGKWNLKYLFYAFYPVHLLILWGIWKIFLA